MRVTIGGSTLELVRGDITRCATDAIVNAANPSLMGGGGVDGAIHMAGGSAIVDECREIIQRIGRCKPGQAVITGGGRLPARHVIHTVGPVWRGGMSGERDVLASAYRESLIRVRENGLSSVAFPSISTGAYGYPVRDAAMTAVSTVAGILRSEAPPLRVLFVLFDDRTFEAYRDAVRSLPEGGEEPDLAGGGADRGA